MNNLGIKIAGIVGVFLSLVQMSKQAADACQIVNAENKSELLLVQNLSFCQQLKKEYQEVHAFETQNFYINVCRHKQKYYYHRKSKNNPNQSLLLRANTILNGNMFRARGRGKTYIVGTNADGYYSSVMHKNNQIIFEPALQSSTLIDNRFETNTGSFSNSQNNQNKWSKCFQDNTKNSWDYSQL